MREFHLKRHSSHPQPPRTIYSCSPSFGNQEHRKRPVMLKNLLLGIFLKYKPGKNTKNINVSKYNTLRIV